MFEAPLAMHTEDDDRVLVVAGSVDEYSIVALRNRIAELLQAEPALTIDLSGVDYLPSAAVGVLARARTAAISAGGYVELVAEPGTPAHRILTITGIPQLETPSEGVDPTPA